ncbi:M10 family metallopeptidase C-terminal domain-containing protein [Xanthobacter flavus]
MLMGGLGRDILTGNEGSDVFVYTDVRGCSLLSFDTIADFSAAGHTIDFSGIDANSVGGTENDALVDVGSDKFSGTAGELRYGNGTLQGDTSGDGVADFLVQVSGAPPLTQANLVL